MGHIVFRPESWGDPIESDTSTEYADEETPELDTPEETRIKELEDKVEKLESRLAILENMVRRT